jgi:hypothetical protein
MMEVGLRAVPLPVPLALVPLPPLLELVSDVPEEPEDPEDPEDPEESEGPTVRPDEVEELTVGVPKGKISRPV